MDRYLAEFDFRYHVRKIKDVERLVEAARQTAGRRLRYNDPMSGEGRT
jgi:hypothetical protein